MATFRFKSDNFRQALMALSSHATEDLISGHLVKRVIMQLKLHKTRKNNFDGIEGGNTWGAVNVVMGKALAILSIWEPDDLVTGDANAPCPSIVAEAQRFHSRVSAVSGGSVSTSLVNWILVRA